MHWEVDESPPLWSHSYPSPAQLMGVERRKDFWKQENKSIASKLYIALIPQLVCNSEGLQTVRLLCNNPWDQIHIEGLWRRRYATKIRPGSIPVYTSKWSVMIKALAKTLFRVIFYLHKFFPPLNVFCLRPYAWFFFTSTTALGTKGLLLLYTIVKHKKQCHGSRDARYIFNVYF